MSRPRTPVIAIARAVGPAFVDALCSVAGRRHDAAAAAAQHAGYVAALRDAGVRVMELPPLHGAPDACFVEDAAVVLGGHALVTRPGAPQRRAEIESIATALAGFVSVARMQGPGALDGGDVMTIDRTLVVGRSHRTDDAGIAALSRFAARTGRIDEVVAFDVAAGLHLKSGMTVIGPHEILVDPDQHEPGRVAACLGPRGIAIAIAPEPLGANVLALGDRVLASADAPRTIAMLRARGHTVVEIPLAALHGADGGLSCLSLRLPAPGTWCV